jgi:hypothetical protein
MTETARFCSVCGNPAGEHQRFCGSCGTAFGQARSAPPDLTAVSGMPPAPPPQQASTRAFPEYAEGSVGAAGARSGPPPRVGPAAAEEGWQWNASALALPALRIDALLAGDWAGGALAAGAGYVAALATALVLSLLAGAEKVPVHATLALVGSLVGAAFGGDVVGHVSADAVGGDGRVGVYPLTITVLSLGVLGLVFWRRVRSRRPGLGEALLQAVRTAVAFAVLLALSSLVLRYHGNLPGGIGATSVHVGTASSAFGGLLLAGLVCAAMCLRKREWLPLRVLAGRDALAAPIAGVGVVLGAGCLLTLLGGVVVLLVHQNGALRQEFSVLLVGLPNLMIWLLFGGTGTALIAHGSAGGSLVSQAGAGGSASTHITDAADSSGWWWLATVGAVLCLLIGALAVVHLSRSLERSRRTLIVFAAVYIAAAPVLAHLATLYVHGQVYGTAGSGDGSLGPSVGGAFAVAVLAGFGAAILALAVAPKLFIAPKGRPPGYATAPGSGWPAPTQQQPPPPGYGAPPPPATDPHFNPGAGQR